MIRKYILLVLIIIILLVVGIFMFSFKNYSDDENTLYSSKFDNIRLRIERYDYVLGQNQIIGVERSINGGRTYEKLTKEPITVSMEPKFIFFNKELGFVISKVDLSKNNKYLGLKVTQDGGKKFNDAIINYDNPNIEILSVLDVPYMENNVLKLPCSIYQVKEDKSGYEDVKIIFVSVDNGLTWNLET